MDNLNLIRSLMECMTMISSCESSVTGTGTGAATICGMFDMFRFYQEDDGNDTNRMRLDASEDSSTTTRGADGASADNDTGMDIATRIWNEIVSTTGGDGGGGMELKLICSDITDRASVRNAVDMMVKKDKVMISEGMVYQV